MTTIPTLSRAETFAIADAASTLRKYLIETVCEWRRRARSRRALTALAERELWDIRLTRADALHEARKPFWRN